MTFQVGMGRVMSLVMTAIFSPGFTISRRRGEPMGASSALLTSASPVSSLFTSLGVSTAIRFLSGTDILCVPVPKPSSSSIIDHPYLTVL